MNTYVQDEQKWNQWFAGLTDGDGCFYINKKEKSVSFELTTHTTDARVMYHLKNKLKGGSIKPRSGSNSVRYRVKAKEVLLDIVNRLNGKLYNPARVRQLIDVCVLMGVEPISNTCSVTVLSALKRETLVPYIAGIIDADGSITINVSGSSADDSQLSGVNGRITRLVNSRGRNQIQAKVTTSSKEYAAFLRSILGIGEVYKENQNKNNKSPNPKYHWTISTIENFTFLYERLKKFPLRSVKMHRMRLALVYFKYKELRYHLQPPGTLEANMWAKFARSWYKYSY
jgi:hypothetical protein